MKYIRKIGVSREENGSSFGPSFKSHKEEKEQRKQMKSLLMRLEQQNERAHLYEMLLRSQEIQAPNRLWFRLYGGFEDFHSFSAKWERG